MKKLLLLFVAVFSLSALTARAAMFTTTPAALQQSSKNVKIIFNAAESGVPALQSATSLYAHIGVTLTSDPSAWTHVKTDWSQNLSVNQFVKNSDGLWELNIGDINTYFGLTANETVAKIAVIARTANGSAQTSDTFLDVLPAGFAMLVSYDSNSLVLTSAKTINFTVSTTEAATIQLTVDGTGFGSASNATTLTKGYNFNQKGKFYTVKATANNGSQTIEKTYSVAYPNPSDQKNYPGGIPKMGTVKNADGSVTFCLAAPNKTNVIIVPSWDNYQTLDKNVMHYQDYNGFRYFWTTVSGLKNDEYYPYYFLIDGITKVADPYAKLMLDPYSDKWLPAACFPDMPQYPYDQFDDTMLAVYRGDIDDYNWDSATKNFKIPAHDSMTVYELLLRDFTGDGSDQNGKHFGTFATAKEKISHLAKLGVNAVELLPIMEFNGNNSWGYNTNGYMALDKAYGSPRQMRDFVAECHRQGIAVILDIVFNQTDGLHPWYQMYDISSNPFYNKTAPHDYSVLNDVNQNCALVAQHWEDVLKYWMTAYKVDGFRFDLVKGLGDNNSYGSGTDGYNQSRVNRMKKLHSVITSVNPNGIHINELLGDASEDNAMGSDGQLNWSKISNGAYQYAMGFAQNCDQTKGFDAGSWGRVVGQTVDYAESHDEQRVANKVKLNGHTSVKYTSTHPKTASVQRLGAVAAQMLLAPGAKMIWQFGEIAADDNFGSDLDKLRAIAPKWDQMTNSARAALFENYRVLCHLRKDNPELFGKNATVYLGDYQANLNVPRWIRVTNGNKEVIGFFNPAVTGAKKTVTAVPTKLSVANSQLVTASMNTPPTLQASGSNLRVELGPHEFAVFATQDVTDVESISEDFTTDNIRVYGEVGHIVIDGDYTNAEVYNLQGQLQNSLEVPAGLYIVRVDGTSFKVNVR